MMTGTLIEFKMINHFYSVLYNFSKKPLSGIEVLLEDKLDIPDVLSSASTMLGGVTAEERDIFAIKSLKVLDSSSYRDRVTSHDSRVSYNIHEIPVSCSNYYDFFCKWITIPEPSIDYILQGELLDTYRTTKVLQEKVASLIVGYVDAITIHNSL